MKAAKWLLVLPAALLACGVILVACGGGAKEGEPHLHGSETWELEASYANMPSFLEDYTDQTKHLYSVVGKYEEIMQLVKCYCGCMEFDDVHTSLHRCYVASKNDKGITWTDHSGHCGICTEELVKIEDWSNEGKTPDQINQLIEENFNPNA
ncbi:PCYCGC domain-containing protein [Cohnella sp. WQ 127256]|uniref:PCYCGC domain-containing protein n=1 Tax=Cohnella sp. WQ 127256 TaxID=2938790 RepID=UPI0021180702|nr:PCYCGC domain-containing protein [Cohnella sp. WQ 127256]